MPGRRPHHGSRRRAAAALIALGLVCWVLAAALVVIGVANGRFLDAVNREIAPPEVTTEARVLATFERVSNWAYFDARRIGSGWRRWLANAEHASPLHLSARTTLTAGADHIGPCGSLSRSMIVLLRRAGIEARKALLCDGGGVAVHTIVEVNLNGEWRVFDPTYRWYWRRPADGAIATAADLAADEALFRSVAAHAPLYPLDAYRYDNVHHLRWDKVPGLQAVRRLLVQVGGESWVRGIRSPYLYERPVYMAGGALWVLGTALLTVAWTIRRRHPVPAAGERPAGRPRSPEGGPRTLAESGGTSFLTESPVAGDPPAIRGRIHGEE